MLIIADKQTGVKGKQCIHDALRTWRLDITFQGSFVTETLFCVGKYEEFIPFLPNMSHYQQSGNSCHLQTDTAPWVYWVTQWLTCCGALGCFSCGCAHPPAVGSAQPTGDVPIQAPLPKLHQVKPTAPTLLFSVKTSETFQIHLWDTVL